MVRNDVITADAQSSEWLGALNELRTDTTRVHAHDYSFGSGATLASDLPDDEHNAWAIRVFDAICAATTANVELLDEDDNVIRSRPAVHAA